MLREVAALFSPSTLLGVVTEPSESRLSETNHDYALMSPFSRPLQWRSKVNSAQELLVTYGCMLVAVNFAVDRRKTSF